MVGIGILWRWPCDEEDALGGDAMFAQPARGELAPVRRFPGEVDRMYAVRKCESLAGRWTAARCDDPGRWLGSGDDTRRGAAARGHEHGIARHGVERVLDERRHAV